jgi:hypothetical protein
MRYLVETPVTHRADENIFAIFVGKYGHLGDEDGRKC